MAEKGGSLESSAPFASATQKKDSSSVRADMQTPSSSSTCVRDPHSNIPPRTHHLTVGSLRSLPRSQSLRISTRKNARVYRRESVHHSTHRVDGIENSTVSGSTEVTPVDLDVLEIIDEKPSEENPPEPLSLPHGKLAKELCLTCLVSAVVLFLCQLVAAGCLCRPLVVLGGLWVAALLLCKGIIGLRAIASPTRPLLVGDVVVSLLGAVAAVMAAAYLVSGHITVSCVSDLHRLDKSTAIRLYVLDFTAILASIPCIAGAVASFIAAALSGQAARSPKKKLAAPVVLFLRGWSDDGVAASTPDPRCGADAVVSNVTESNLNSARLASPTQQPTLGSHDTGPSSCAGSQRCSTPPPNYNQVTRESFA